MTVKQSPLISCKKLQAMLNTEGSILLDASIQPVGGVNLPEKRWPEHTIDQAKKFDIDGDFSCQQSQLPHTLPSPKDFEHRLRKLGISHDSNVVVYDCYGIFSAARAWWMLKAMGVVNVFVLNGGLPAWIASGGVTKQATYPPFTESQFKVSFQAEYFVDQQAIMIGVMNNDVTIIDARSHDRFYGLAKEPRQGLRSGHIPHSSNVPYASLLDELGCMKSKAALNEILAPIIKNNQRIITTCGSGVTACIISLALAVIGRSSSVYDGSWSEWGADSSLPISI